MADNDNNLDFQQALDAGTKKMDLSDLEKKGFKKVKVLDEKTASPPTGRPRTRRRSSPRPRKSSTA